MTAPRSRICTLDVGREQIQEHTSAVIGEENFKVWFWYTAPEYDPPSPAAIEFVRADREIRPGVWSPMQDDELDTDWCRNWLEACRDAAIEEGEQAFAHHHEARAAARRAMLEQ